MKKLMKQAVVIAMALLVLTAVPVFAADPVNNDLLWGGADKQGDFQNNVGLGSADPRDIVAKVIQVILGFLGIIAVIIILLGGFKWMTAGGNEDKVGEAKKLITAGIIGLVIILAAYAIASFVLTQLMAATSTTV